MERDAELKEQAIDASFWKNRSHSPSWYLPPDKHVLKERWVVQQLCGPSATMFARDVCHEQLDPHHDEIFTGRQQSTRRSFTAASFLIDLRRGTL